ncbi:MAG: tyrosine-type recombinase/integrase [Clostridia bacterium]|nr:tyrosine-type recombinase/integrase [Clostridia bacterium]
MACEYKSCISTYVTSFLEQQKATVSSHCFVKRCGILHHFDKYLVETGCKDCNFTEKTVFGWISKAGEGKRASTVDGYVGTLRSFFKFLSGFGFYPFMPPYPKVNDDYIAYEFTDEEINQIFSIADNYVVVPFQTREYIYIQYELPMALRLLLGCGLRLGEASTLRLSDIDFTNNTLIIRRTKSKEYRLVPMDPSLSDILHRYCLALGLGKNKDAYIFPGRDYHEPIPTICFRRYFSRILKKADITQPGIKKHQRGPCIHCLRHAFAHRSFRKGVDDGWVINDQIPWLSIYLGHKDLQETERYLRSSSELYCNETGSFESYSEEFFPEVSFNG